LEKPVVIIGVAAGLFYVINEWRERIRFRRKFLWTKGVIVDKEFAYGKEKSVVSYVLDGQTYTAVVAYHPDLLKKDIGKTVKLAINPEDISDVHVAQRSQTLQLWTVTILLGCSSICLIMAGFLYLLGD
jgi:hypothetical protein